MLFWILFQGMAYAQSFSAHAAVEKTEVFMGEPFVFQVQVEGHDAPDTPDVSGIQDFIVEYQGGRQNSSSSVTIINGQISRNEKRGYIFSYQLTPKRVGSLKIPAITVHAGAGNVSTQGVPIRASQPAETDDFKLRMQLSSTQAYVGQPIDLTFTWYIGKNVEDYQFSLPILSDSRFQVIEANPVIDPQQQQRYLKIPAPNLEIIAKQGQGTLANRQYSTVQFQISLIPNQPGNLSLPEATVAFTAVMGYQKSRRSGSAMDNFFGDDFFFGNRQQSVQKKFVVPSNRLNLNVLPLPSQGQPPHFTGLVGSYRIVASAAPTEVRVGDPITLTLQITGPNYLGNVKLPPLHTHPELSRRFKIPKDMAAGTLAGGVITFTQTLRANAPEVSEIPSLELPYFDTDTGQYAIAKTQAIPLQVNSARIITAKDAEGVAAAESTKVELQTWTAGIAYNYEDLSVLKNQPKGGALWTEPLWLILLMIPPGLYFTLLGLLLFIRHRDSETENRQIRRAYGTLFKAIKEATSLTQKNAKEGYAVILGAVRQYLGTKLNLASAALTYPDVRDKLLHRGVDDETLERVKRLFDECEAKRYAGGSIGVEDPASFLKEAQALAKTLNRILK
ncbi:BatD family protein [Deltaproteobacteria bacterium TL4]